jgi:hypothetical protein
VQIYPILVLDLRRCSLIVNKTDAASIHVTLDMALFRGIHIHNRNITNCNSIAPTQVLLPMMWARATDYAKA